MVAPLVGQPTNVARPSVGRRLQLVLPGVVEDLMGLLAEEPSLAECDLAVDEDLMQVRRRSVRGLVVLLLLPASLCLGMRRLLPQLIKGQPLSTYRPPVALRRLDTASAGGLVPCDTPHVALLGDAVPRRTPLITRSWVVRGLHPQRHTPVPHGARQPSNRPSASCQPSRECTTMPR